MRQGAFRILQVNLTAYDFITQVKFLHVIYIKNLHWFNIFARVLQFDIKIA